MTKSYSNRKQMFNDYEVIAEIKEVTPTHLILTDGTAFRYSSFETVAMSFGVYGRNGAVLEVREPLSHETYHFSINNRSTLLFKVA